VTKRFDDGKVEAAFKELQPSCGGVKEDYLGLLYLEREFRVAREDAILQNAFGGNDFGIDGYHIDVTRRNLYLLQFKYSTNASLFKDSYQRLATAGFPLLFHETHQNRHLNPILHRLKSQLLNDMALIDRVFVLLVFLGDTSEAERSETLRALQENLESKSFLLDQFFGRQVSLIVEYRSAATQSVSSVVHQRRTHTYTMHVPQIIERSGPKSERMFVGFARLVDLHQMYREMGVRFFERNIRSGLTQASAPNRAIRKSLKAIVLEETESPEIFAFNHNGVTISASAFACGDGVAQITEPRLLNGAQTVTTFHNFLEQNRDNRLLTERLALLDRICLPCRIITNASTEFVTTVTVNTNRQNPVESWNLRANDLIQCQISDWFRTECKIYYERQTKMFDGLTDEQKREEGFEDRRPIEIQRLAKTYLAMDGRVDRMSNMREAFESEKLYPEIFHARRLDVNPGKLLLCYKVQFALNQVIAEIRSRGASRYAFLPRARNLLWAILCQALLNDPKLDDHVENYGQSLTIEAGYRSLLRELGSRRVRPLISRLVASPGYAEQMAEGQYAFLRTHAACKSCLQTARSEWAWKLENGE
jgi:hypothetical protein